MSDLQSFFSGRRVLVTGHTGFKGAWLVALLNQLGAQVKGYALEPERAHDLYNDILGDELCDSTIADIRSYDELWRAVTVFQPDLIIHMAAQSLVLRSYEMPVQTYQVNVMGTVNVLECVRHLDKRCDVVIITTDKVYENAESGDLFSEGDRLGGADPYSNSKACCELVVSAYRHSFFSWDKFDAHQKCVASARSGNVIGGGDWSEHRIVPDIVRALGSNQAVNVRNPNSVRPWQFVLEPLVGYLQLAMKMRGEPQHFSEAFNFGPSETDMLTVEELVRRAISMWGTGSMENTSDDQPHEAKHLQLSSKKAHNMIGWKPQLTADEAIRMTLSWYKSDEPKKMTLEQIKSYLERL